MKLTEKRREDEKTPEDDRKNRRQVSAAFGQKPIKLNTAQTHSAGGCCC